MGGNEWRLFVLLIGLVLLLEGGGWSYVWAHDKGRREWLMAAGFTATLVVAYGLLAALMLA